MCVCGGGGGRLERSTIFLSPGHRDRLRGEGGGELERSPIFLSLGNRDRLWSGGGGGGGIGVISCLPLSRPPRQTVGWGGGGGGGRVGIEAMECMCAQTRPRPIFVCLFCFVLFCFIISLRRELSPTRKLKWPGRNRVQIMRKG